MHAPALLAADTGLSVGELKRVMQKGAVWLQRGGGTRRLRRAKAQLKPGDVLLLYYNPEVLAEAPIPATLVHDAGDFSVWAKPRGMRSQGSRFGDHTTIGRWAENHLQPQRPAFVVHRLDRAAAGLILLAHKKSVAAAFARMFRERRVEKTYRVWVSGAWPDTEGSRTLNAPLDGREAVTSARRIAFDERAERSLLEVGIETGRKHQIRRHLAGIGFPVLGDRLYGNARDDDMDLQLTAVSLAFECPVSGEARCFELVDDALAGAED